MKEFWDERYSSNEYIYGVNPNRFFKNFIDSNRKGKILLPADGEGRNGVYAALSGWDVTSFDYSKVGVEKSLALAKEHNITVKAELSSAEEFTTEEESFDYIAMVFLHMKPDERQQIHNKLMKYLRPGGKIFICAFTKEQHGKDSGGPGNIDLLFDSHDILRDFDGLLINYIDEIAYEIDEGTHHSGKANVLCFSATK